MWGFPVPSVVDIDSPTYAAAQAIVDVARKSIDDEAVWIAAVRKIAKIIAEWNPEKEENLAGSAVADVASKEIPYQGGTVVVPVDIDTVMGNPVEIRNGDRARRCSRGESALEDEAEMERLAVEVDKRGGDIRELRDVYLVAGFGSDSAMWIRFWYRAKAKGLLRTDVRRRTVSGMTPLSPEVWRLGDPIEELDLVQSLQAFPIIVPNMSTRRWATTIQRGQEMSHSMPDLLIVIDSSGSMTYSMRKKGVSGPYHVALVSAFAALDLALRNNRRVSVINFSDGIHTCQWSTERSNPENILLQYQGGGTVAPVQAIRTMCAASESQVMVVLITDAEIHNWEDLASSVRELITRGHKVFIFRIGRKSRQDSVDKSLSEAGATIIPVASIQSLPGLVVREAKQVYDRDESGSQTRM
jgi:Mg-chelatase subunit ChlD